MFEIEVIVVATAPTGSLVLLGGGGLPSAPLAPGVTARETAAALAASLTGFPAEPWGWLREVGFVDRPAGPKAVLYSYPLPETFPLARADAAWVAVTDLVGDASLTPETKDLAMRSVSYRMNHG